MKRATRHVSADVASPAVFAKSYQYDALGRLRSDTVEDLTAATTGDATVYNYDGQNIARTYVIAGDGVVRDYRFYTHSNNTDELLGLALADPNQSATTAARNRDPEPGVGYYAHTDHQGSIRAITDDTGAVVNQYTYGAYGNTETAVEATPQRFRYTGREWDKDIALMHYRARIYDPDSGRFLQEDPIGFAAMHPRKSDIFDGEFPTNKFEQGYAVVYASELNIYRYTSNNPILYTDPSGTIGFSGFRLKSTILFIQATKKIRPALKTAAMLAAGNEIKKKAKFSPTSCVKGFFKGLATGDPVGSSNLGDASSNAKVAGAFCRAIGAWLGSSGGAF